MTTPNQTPARVAPERRESCQWKYDGSDCCYQTECGEAFCFIDGSAADNGVFYCHHCSGLVRVVRLCFECDVEIPEASESNLCVKCLTAEDDNE